MKSEMVAHANFEKITAEKGAEFAEMVAFLCRARALVGMIANVAPPSAQVVETTALFSVFSGELITFCARLGNVDQQDLDKVATEQSDLMRKAFEDSINSDTASRGHAGESVH